MNPCTVRVKVPRSHPASAHVPMTSRVEGEAFTAALLFDMGFRGHFHIVGAKSDLHDTLYLLLRLCPEAGVSYCLPMQSGDPRVRR